jgi:hypothetical protein
LEALTTATADMPIAWRPLVSRIIGVTDSVAAAMETPPEQKADADSSNDEPTWHNNHLDR